MLKILIHIYQIRTLNMLGSFILIVLLQELFVKNNVVCLVVRTLRDIY